jgi:hypothetical protein
MKIRSESEVGIVQRYIGLQLQANRFYSPQDMKRWGMHPKSDEEQAEQDAARAELAALRERMTADDLWLAAKERRQIIGVGQNYAASLNGYNSVSQKKEWNDPPAPKGDTRKSAKKRPGDPFAYQRENQARYDQWQASQPPIAGILERVRWSNAGTPERFGSALKRFAVYQDQAAPSSPPPAQVFEMALHQRARYPELIVMAAIRAQDVYTHLLQPVSEWSERVFQWDEQRARPLLPGDLIEEGGGTGQYWLVMSDHLEKVCSLPEKEVFP